MTLFLDNTSPRNCFSKQVQASKPLAFRYMSTCGSCELYPSLCIIVILVSHRVANSPFNVPSLKSVVQDVTMNKFTSVVPTCCIVLWRTTVLCTMHFMFVVMLFG
jgi:hypothetical protein